MRLTESVLFLGLVLALPSLNGWSESSPKDTTVSSPVEDTVDAKEFVGSVVHLDRKVSYFQVDLPENPTTGFKCYLSKYDAQSLEPLSSTYTPKKLSFNHSETGTTSPAETPVKTEVNSVVGVGGVRTFVFQVKPAFHNAPQKTTIEFRYDRPWASGEKSAKKVITVYSS
jgi:predicted secreted protein